MDRFVKVMAVIVGLYITLLVLHIADLAVLHEYLPVGEYAYYGLFIGAGALVFLFVTGFFRS